SVVPGDDSAYFNQWNGGAHRARGSDRCARRTHLLSHRILRAHLALRRCPTPLVAACMAAVRRVGMMLQGEILSLRSDVATPRRVAGCDTSQYLWSGFLPLVSDRLVV